MRIVKEWVEYTVEVQEGDEKPTAYALKIDPYCRITGNVEVEEAARKVFELVYAGMKKSGIKVEELER